jgi:alpha-amylase/alpha-mannosidase (GH57 family)
MDRYICIHAHFYQPPRENPWLEAIEQQDSAYPYHDWNERITAECYAPNALSRILDNEQRIDKLVNNYAKISFNFGPTLLSWLDDKAPEIYQAILEADRESQRNCSGHGGALAQAYNHLILPLANRRDRYTQVIWGIRDFEQRFGRGPEGMWLPETAVDLETLDILAELGIRFTILASHQAARVRRIGDLEWRDVSGGTIDPTRAYEQDLPSGRKIALFFYDAPVSRAVAFEGLLTRGENFVGRLLGAFSETRRWSQLVHIATDGESYGHHHRFGDMALAYALSTIEAQKLARLTNYAEFLEKHPATHQVEIIENTSWSCFHGVERWRTNCGCNSGGHPGWNQEWRAPLRAAFDWLRDTVAPLYETGGERFLIDPWAARDDYLNVINDRSTESLERFFRRHAIRELSEADKSVALRMLEMQRHALLMYSSCGWFFDELSGVETVQAMQYAARAVQLAQELFPEGLESQLVDRLSLAKSNLAQLGNGSAIYEKFVQPAKVNWMRIGAHYAITSLFNGDSQITSTYCYAAERREYELHSAGKARLAIGRVRLTSRVTRESSELCFCILHLGDHIITGAASASVDEEAYRTLKAEVQRPFASADFPEVIRIMDRFFGEANCSLKSLFSDEQRKVLERILAARVEETEILFRQIYEDHSAIMRFLTNLQMPLPKALRAAAEVTINTRLRQAFQNDAMNDGDIRALIDRAKADGVALDSATLEFMFRRNLERRAESLALEPAQLERLQELERAVSLVGELPFSVNLWQVQNVYYQLLRTIYPEMQRAGAAGDGNARTWIACFVPIGKKIGVRVTE